jgi:hypothetical protein
VAELSWPILFEKREAKRVRSQTGRIATVGRRISDGIWRESRVTETLDTAVHSELKTRAAQCGYSMTWEEDGIYQHQHQVPVGITQVCEDAHHIMKLQGPRVIDTVADISAANI